MPFNLLSRHVTGVAILLVGASGISVDSFGASGVAFPRVGRITVLRVSLVQNP